MSERTINASWVLSGAQAAALANQSMAIDGGKIASIERGPGEINGDGALVMPALANAHDHARVARLSQVGSYDVPLEAWLPYLTLIPAVDPYLASAVSFGRTARGGVGAVMAHYTRVQGLTDFPTEAKVVAKAARDVGIRMALAVHCRDLNPLVYDPHEALLAELSPAACECVARRFLRKPLSPADQVAMVETVAAEVEGDGVTVQYGPAGVQWCTDAMLRLIGEASARTGRRVHMHLLETKYQRAWADRTFPQGIVHYLDEIGLLNERMSFAHCIYLRPDEMELLAERGATRGDVVLGVGEPLTKANRLVIRRAQSAQSEVHAIEAGLTVDKAEALADGHLIGQAQQIIEHARRSLGRVILDRQHGGETALQPAGAGELDRLGAEAHSAIGQVVAKIALGQQGRPHLPIVERGQEL